MLQLSNPKSAKYGQYKSIEQIADMIAPSDHQIDQVITFFKSNSHVEHVKLSLSRDFLQVWLSISELELLFKVKMSLFYNRVSKQVILRSQEMYALPAEISDLVDMVSMISDFPGGFLPPSLLSNVIEQNF